MKKIYESCSKSALLLLFSMGFLLFSRQTFAQTLATGDISILGVNSNAPDGFAFVNWVSIPNGTVIKFTDNAFNSTALSNTAGNFREGEQYVIWTNNTGNPIAAGTIITIQADAVSSPTTMITNRGTITSVTNSSNGTPTATMSLINNAGDQIFAFQGAGGPSTNSATATFSGTLLFGLGYSGSAVASTTWQTTGPSTGNTSYLPSDLSGTSQIFLGPNFVGGQYTGPTSGQASLAAYKALVADPSNWNKIGSGTVTFSTAPSATFTAGTAPSITSQPSNSNICAGANTTFGIIASDATSYKWQVSTNGGGSFSDLSNTAPYSNATTATLTITGATSAMNQYQYKCIASGSSSPDATSNAVTLTVNSAPAITAQPSASTICAGANTTFSATASNATGYQWQVDQGAGFSNVSATAPYSGTTSATLTITGATAGLNGYIYRVVATGGCTPNATSNTAALTVNSAPAITAQPSASTICAGANTTFSATASNATGYQWQVDQGAGFNSISNNATYSGATTATLTITGATAGLNGYIYRVVVTGNCTPNATSNSSALTVNMAPAITAQPSASTVCAGANTTFTATAANATSYQWQVDQGAGFSNVSATAPYSGTTSATLTITGATAGLNGYIYRVVATGGCTPNATSNSAALTVNPAPAITAQPFNANACPGSGASFSITAANATSYQWQVDQGAGFSSISNGAPYSGVTSTTLVISGATTGMNGYLYRCIATGSCSPAATSNSALLTIALALDPVITTEPSNKTVCAGNSTTFTASTFNATSYQWQVNQGSGFANVPATAPYSGGTTTTLTISNATTALNGYQYRLIATGACTSTTSNSATLSVITAPSVTTHPSASTVCSGANTTFSATVSNATGYQWQVNQGSGFVNIPTGAPYSGETTATLTISGTTAGFNGYLYRVIATGPCTPSATSNSAALTVNSAPAITNHPSASTICAGANTTFSATVTNATGYQWQVDQGAGFNNIANAAPYTGATTAILTITGATTGLNGYLYRVVATGTCTPAANSNSAALTVNTTPAITLQPIASTVCEGANTTFTVTASNTTGYQWQVDQGSGFSNISDDVTYSGATNATLNITSTTAGLNGYLYRVIATGACTPNANSNSVALTVNTAPAITAQPAASTICAGNNTAFSVTASNATGYQWQVDQGSGFSNISDDAVYSGSTSATLTITGATANLNTYLYKAIISGVCSPDATSDDAALTVNSAPSITTQPIAYNTCEGSDANFSVVATGAMSYQWQEDAGSGFSDLSETSPYSGVTTANFSIAAVIASMNNYEYRCIISGICTPDATSDNVALTTNDVTVPIFTNCPANANITAGVYNYTVPVATDNCGGTPTVVRTTGLGDGASFPVGVTTETYTATDAAGNVATCSFTVTATTVTTVNIQTLNNDLNIYPNPATDRLNIKTDNAQNLTVILLDLTGQTVLTYQSTAAATEHIVNISSLSKGLYLINIINGTEKITTKIIVE